MRLGAAMGASATHCGRVVLSKRLKNGGGNSQRALLAEHEMVYFQVKTLAST
ncbi:uncharacterized protein PHALS_04843 [Plasmopara halstedii]|uniref:Uncharacterized protein n=1 Tax=Plasmopara halstedii TaxID=4781 RepID=A0A0P1B2K5_PLAHL|nr:uncharacterized protein PHALS_04843 [Plasmopara halstedii]CEG47697.1 hypothetical protein PHALS_04843 [Plasmopara halstedii]|eukprot:XP_024584066.1 hypothetical protein PHALS_04843 [Plasmopara halstedii]